MGSDLNPLPSNKDYLLPKNPTSAVTFTCQSTCTSKVKTNVGMSVL